MSDPIARAQKIDRIERLLMRIEASCSVMADYPKLAAETHHAELHRNITRADEAMNLLKEIR